MFHLKLDFIIFNKFILCTYGHMVVFYDRESNIHDEINRLNTGHFYINRPHYDIGTQEAQTKQKHVL